VEVKITDYAIAHLVESVELTLGGASIEKREAIIEQVLE
jgi:hypothetical protein